MGGTDLENNPSPDPGEQIFPYTLSINFFIRSVNYKSLLISFFTDEGINIPMSRGGDPEGLN